MVAFFLHQFLFEVSVSDVFFSEEEAFIDDDDDGDEGWMDDGC